MQITRGQIIRSVKKWARAFVDGLIFQNPVLIGGMGLYLVLCGSTSLEGALFLSLLLIVLTVPVCVICWLAGKWIPVWLRLPLAFFLTSVLYLPWYPDLQRIHPQFMQALGLCGILAVADSLLLMRAFSPEKRPLPFVLAEALGGAVGFSVVLLTVSVLWRLLEELEQVGGGSFSRARVALGLIAVALLAALWKYGINRYKQKRGRGLL